MLGKMVPISPFQSHRSSHACSMFKLSFILFYNNTLGGSGLSPGGRRYSGLWCLNLWTLVLLIVDSRDRSVGGGCRPRNQQFRREACSYTTILQPPYPATILNIRTGGWVSNPYLNYFFLFSACFFTFICCHDFDLCFTALSAALSRFNVSI